MFKVGSGLTALMFLVKKPGCEKLNRYFLGNTRLLRPYHCFPGIKCNPIYLQLKKRLKEVKTIHVFNVKRTKKFSLQGDITGCMITLVLPSSLPWHV